MTEEEKPAAPPPAAPPVVQADMKVDETESSARLVDNPEVAAAAEEMPELPRQKSSVSSMMHIELPAESWTIFSSPNSARRVLIGDDL